MPVRKKAPEDLTAKKALALEVIRRLKAEYPDAGCTLDYDHAWQLLVSVRLPEFRLQRWHATWCRFSRCIR